MSKRITAVCRVWYGYRPDIISETFTSVEDARNWAYEQRIKYARFGADAYVLAD